LGIWKSVIAWGGQGSFSFWPAVSPAGFVAVDWVAVDWVPVDWVAVGWVAVDWVAFDPDAVDPVAVDDVADDRFAFSCGSPRTGVMIVAITAIKMPNAEPQGVPHLGLP
jgi:hypothetical protein